MTYEHVLWLLLGAGLSWREADEIALSVTNGHHNTEAGKG